MTNDLDMEPSDIRDSELGTTFTPKQLKEQCHVLYGGIAWPGKRPGFGVVLALSKEKHPDGYNIYLVDEVESPDMRLLIHRCAAVDVKYRPLVWLGDHANGAASRLIDELNLRLNPPRGYDPGYEPPDRRMFYVSPSQLLEMERPYQYMLPMVKALLDQSRRQLFLKDSRIVPYLGEIKSDEIPFLDFGEYPSIEALAFAVTELLTWRPPEPDRRRRDRRVRLDRMNM